MSMMKKLMDDFYDLKNDDIAYSFTIDIAVDYANSCHGLSSIDTLQKVEEMLNNLKKMDAISDDSEYRAIDDSILIVQMNREDFLNNKS